MLMKYPVSEIAACLRRLLSKSRYEHSVRTAFLCAALCPKEQLDVQSGYLCGLIHDCARELPEELLVATGKKLGFDDLQAPVLYHGAISAYIAKEIFGIENEDILFSIAHHTLGHGQLSRLGKILFVSDYCEFGRTYISDEERSEILGLTLDKMVIYVIKHSQKTFSKNLNPVTMELYQSVVRSTV